MSRRPKDKNNKNSGATSTKELDGVRVGGVLYLKKGVGTGCFSRVNSSVSGETTSIASSQILPNCKK